MGTSRPRFSIVIPCYNEARFISRTLQSLQRQKYTGSYEIIVVDNNCTDKTVEIARTFGVTVVTENRPGVCWARQAGTEAAGGEIVISTDADTLHPENWLQTIDRTFEQYGDCVAVAGPCIYNDGPWWGRQYPKVLFGTVSQVYKLTGRPFYITATNIAFRGSAWTGYHTSMTQGGDELALLHDLRRKGKVVFNNSNPVFTSGRRLTKGLTYNLFITFLTYYLLAYHVNRLSGRTLIGTAPAYRTTKPVRSRRGLAYGSAAVVVGVTLIHLPGHETLLQQSVETFGDIIRSHQSKKHDTSALSSHHPLPSNKLIGYKTHSK